MNVASWTFVQNRYAMNSSQNPIFSVCTGTNSVGHCLTFMMKFGIATQNDLKTESFAVLELESHNWYSLNSEAQAMLHFFIDSKYQCPYSAFRHLGMPP